MSPVNGVQQPESVRTPDAFSEGGLRAPPGLSPLRKLWWWIDFLILVKLARLRFIGVLVAIGAVIAYWDTLHAYYDKWTRIAPEHAAAAADVEWWCPMHPTIVRDAPDKCPICGMPLSKRKKGDHADEEPLPPGVVSRVQLTPYRVALAGIQTAEIGYQPLAREITTVGTVEFDERKLARIAVRLTGKTRIDKLYASVTGQSVAKGDPLALVYNPDLVTTLQNLRDARQGGNRDLERIARERLRLWGIEEDQIKEALTEGGDATHLVIHSPISGHVIRKYQVEGDYVEEGSRLYDVADLSTVWIEAQVYEDEIGLLRERTPVSATTRAFPNREFTGMLAFLQPHLDANTRTLQVRFNMDNGGHELRPGAYATVTLKVPAVTLGEVSASRIENWRDRTVAELTAQHSFDAGRDIRRRRAGVVAPGGHGARRRRTGACAGRARTGGDRHRQPQDRLPRGRAGRLRWRGGAARPPLRRILPRGPGPTAGRPGGDIRLLPHRRGDAPDGRGRFDLLRRQWRAAG